jgi:arginyl-tRNA synthetase
VKIQLEAALKQAVDTLLSEHQQQADVPVRLTRPKSQEHGDYAANVAMPLAGLLGSKPHAVAEMILARVAWPAAVEAADIAGPGFINIRLRHDSESDIVRRVMQEKERFGWREPRQDGVRTCLEFVSANPTGPMHVGHGRGAVVGDAIGRILVSQGGDLHREYYINDAGAQVGVLADSVWLRMRELQGEPVVFPDSAYPGEYVIDIARDILADEDFSSLARMSEEERRQRIGRRAVAANMTAIRADLAALGIQFDHFFSESDLHGSGRVAALIGHLREQGLAYEGTLPPPKGKEVDDYVAEPQLLFRTTRFGDDVDRPLLKQDGSPTYFAADIAYHMDKHERGFAHMIDVWGADHGGYVARVQAAMKALTGREAEPGVVLVQMVNLTRGGEQVRMSKRAGTFVTLREVVDETGSDAVRFNFLTRRSESQLDFDLEAAKKQSDENPVYYVQYAHARVCAILRKAAEEHVREVEPEDVDLSRLSADEEVALIKGLLQFPETLQQAADRLEPYRLAIYLMQLAADLHGFYHKHRVIQDDDGLTQARLLLVKAVGQTIRNGLMLLGVSAPERM